MLSSKMLANKELIRKQLRQPLVVIENALDKDIAEQLYKELLRSDAWEHQDRKTENYIYRRDIIHMDSKIAPFALKQLNSCLSSKETRQWFSDISGKRCDSFKAAATIFNEGDQITEHNDLYIYDEPGKPRYVRALTFNYYLSKGWNTEWGGNFIWKEPYKKISPLFNTLVLFIVTTSSHHWVEPVNQATDAKRLSITGWYLTELHKDKFKLTI